MEYEEIRERSTQEAEAAYNCGEPEELAAVAISVGLYSFDLAWAQDYCLRLSNHGNDCVRGNAILALGHLARRFGTLDEQAVKPLVIQALNDSSEHVRGQAWACLEDLECYLNWCLPPQ